MPKAWQLNLVDWNGTVVQYWLFAALMSQNLVPIRKFAYIFDRQQFGMIGTVTQRDTILEWGGSSKDGLCWGGENAGGVTDDTVPQGSLTGSERPANDTSASCVGSWLPKICHFLFWKPPLVCALGEFSGQAGLAPWTLAF